MPGMGQLYIHRIITAFFALCVWIGIVYQSHFLEGLQYTLLMDFTKAADVVDKQWILFLPSIYGFALYDAYANTVENNKLFDRDQINYLNANFQNNQFAFPYEQPAEIEGETMHVISSFDHSIYVELVITALIEEGIPKNNIFSVSLDKRKEKPRMFDTLHQSDGISLFDTGAACGTALAVIGSSYGFILKGGPILWGCIGAIVGFLIGFAIDLLVKGKSPNNQTKGKMSEVVILVDCRKEQVDRVESILWKHFAFGVAKVGG
jgi:hypothetical protein